MRFWEEPREDRVREKEPGESTRMLSEWRQQSQWVFLLMTKYGPNLLNLQSFHAFELFLNKIN